MINPRDITKFDRTKEELEEFFIFSILVAGKTASQIAKRQPLVFDTLRELYPVECHNLPDIQLAYACGYEATADALRRNGIGCHRQKARTLCVVARDSLMGAPDLRWALPDRYEVIPGIGPKTARFFILHSRPGARLAVLDTHILAWMRAKGWDAPKATPTGKKYRVLEEKFLDYCDANGYAPAQLDLIIWNERSRT